MHVPRLTTLARRAACGFLITLALIHPSASAADASWFALDGTSRGAGNPADEDGRVRSVESAALRVTRTSEKPSLGTVLLFPGGGYKHLSVVSEGSLTAEHLNRAGYDVATLEYHVNAGPETRDLALGDARAAWNLLRSQPDKLGVTGARGIVMGYSAGGHLAARLTAQLAASNQPQPDDLVLVYPAYLEERPTLAPPAKPTSRLLVIFAANDRKEWIDGARGYVDAWRKNGGHAIYQEFPDGGHGFGMKPGLKGDIAQWPEVLAYHLRNGVKPGVGPFNTVLPWFLKNERGRLQSFRKSKAADQGAIVFLGDSITAKWDLAKAFPDLKTANRGISGDTTRGMLCRFQDNVLDLKPEAVVLMGGTNDLVGEPPGTPETIAANVRDMLGQIHAASPDTPVFLCEILPSSKRPADAVRATNTAVDKVAAVFPNVRRVRTHDAFLKEDGTLNASLFLDGTHPNEAGYEVWRKVLTPVIDSTL